MASEMGELTLVLKVPFTAGVAGTPSLDSVNYTTCAAGDPVHCDHTGLHADDTPAVPRDLVAGDLTGTTQALIDSVIADAKTKAGIA